ncbi:MAG TPA: polysaccharide lyase family 7 protein [Opitutaceae bacterium]|jgi:hypothetical protein|nr:polysaccharide lyase family 7 protein [Opitutaceae bacterium]
MNTLPGLLLRRPLRRIVSSFAALALVGGLSLAAHAQIGSGWCRGGETIKALQTSAGCSITPIPGGYEFHVPAGPGRAELRWSGADLTTQWLWEGTAKITQWPALSSFTCIYQLWAPPSGDVMIAMAAGGGTTTDLISLHDARKVVGTVPVGVPFNFAAICDPATATEYIYINQSLTGTTILIDPPSGHYDRNGLDVMIYGSGPATIDWTNMSNWKHCEGPPPPEPPTNLTATGKTDTTVALSWTAPLSSGVTGYNIYNGGALAGTTASTSFTVTSLTASTAYTFTATAIYGTVESAHSNSVTVTTNPATVPLPPTNLTVSNLTGTTATVSWTASTSPGVTGYTVSGFGAPPAVVLDPIMVTGTSFPFNELTPGAHYTVNVVAIMASGSFSAPASISFTTPLSPPVVLPPTNLMVTNLTSTTATVSWTASTSPNVTGYMVSGGPGLVFPSTTPTTPATSYAFTGLTPNTTYTINVSTVAEFAAPPPLMLVSLKFSLPVSISFTTPSPIVLPPVIKSPATASGTVGAAFSYQIVASNSPTSYGATGLPAGLSVDASTGLISGTPGAPGTFTVMLSATNAAGTGNQTLTLKISIDWILAGAADFSGNDLSDNGQSDLIWQNMVSGQRTIWLMNGTTPASEVSLGTVSTDWEIVGAADFNQDGNSDLIWQNTVTGQRALWLMNGTNYVRSVDLGSLPLAWQLVGTGKFGGTAQPDLIWQNTKTGQRALWMMNGTTYVSAVSLGTVTTDWNLVGAADFIKNGNSDLIWRNTGTGQCALWMMKGITETSAVNLGTVTNNWRLVGAGNFNGDRQPDLIWQDMTSRQYAFWLMNGTSYGSSVTSTVPLPPGQNFDLSNWKLQEPIGSPGSPKNIAQPQLATFTDAYFYTDVNDGAMDFWCPENGVTTPNSSFPRSELREVKTGGDWPEAGTHTLTATLMVKDTEAHVCIGQIHVGTGGSPASTKPLIELYDYSQDSTHKNGDIYLSLELNPGPPAYTSLPQQHVFITNVPIGTKFDYTIQLSGNTLTVMIHDPAQPSAVTKTLTVDPSFDNELFYFKAGDYLQVAGGTRSTVGAHVSFYALNVTHQP